MTTLDTIIGVSLALAGSTIQSGAFITQKYAHNKVNEANEDIPKDKQKSVMSKWYWWVGIIVYAIGGSCNSIALNFAAQSIISPLGAFSLVMIAIFSYFILNEPLTIKDGIAICIIGLGIVVVIYFGPSGDENAGITIEQLRIYFQGIPYIITIIILSSITILDYIGVKYAEQQNFKSETNDEITYGKNFLLFSYTYIAAFFAANNTLFIKSAVSIIASSVVSEEALLTNVTDYLSYIVLVAFFTCLFSMEYWRQKGLSNFGALLLVPIYTVVNILMTSVIGMIFFEEYHNFTVMTGSLYAVGILVTVCGVVVLSVDIAKVWSELYDDEVKVAFVNYDRSEYKYPKTVVYGGAVNEYYANYHLKKPGVCYNELYDDLVTNQDMEQLVDKESQI